MRWWIPTHDVEAGAGDGVDVCLVLMEESGVVVFVVKVRLT